MVIFDFTDIIGLSILAIAIIWAIVSSCFEKRKKKDKPKKTKQKTICEDCFHFTKFGECCIRNRWTEEPEMYPEKNKTSCYAYGHKR